MTINANAFLHFSLSLSHARSFQPPYNEMCALSTQIYIFYFYLISLLRNKFQHKSKWKTTTTTSTWFSFLFVRLVCVCNVFRWKFGNVKLFLCDFHIRVEPLYRRLFTGFIRKLSHDNNAFTHKPARCVCVPFWNAKYFCSHKAQTTITTSLQNSFLTIYFHAEIYFSFFIMDIFIYLSFLLICCLFAVFIFVLFLIHSAYMSFICFFSYCICLSMSFWSTRITKIK